MSGDAQGAKEPLLKLPLREQIGDSPFFYDKIVILKISDVDQITDAAQLAGMLQRKLLNSRVERVVIQINVNQNAQQWADTLLESVFRTHLQSLTSVKVTGALVNSDVVFDAMTENYFVRKIDLPTERPLAVKQVEKRNRDIANYQGIEKRKGSAFHHGLIGSILLFFGFMTSAVTHYMALCSFFGIIDTLMIGALLPPFVLVGFAACFTIPIAIAHGIVSLVNHVYRRRYAKLLFPQPNTTREVDISLTKQQIEGCNHLINSINRADKSLKIEPLATSKSEQSQFRVSSQRAALVMTLVQFANMISATALVNLTTTDFNKLMDIARSCGYGANSHKEIPVLASGGTAPLLLEHFRHSRYKITELLRSLNPARGRYNNVGVFKNNQQWHQSTWKERSDITFSDFDMALKCIRQDRVFKATVFVDTTSLKRLVVACNDNVRLGELTLKFADDITEADAKLIAQIIYRNAVHLRRINLSDAKFASTEAFAHIEKALRCNGAITQFDHVSQSEEVEKRIAALLKRNGAIGRETPYMLRGISIGAVVGTFTALAGMLVPMALFPSALLTTTGLILVSSAPVVLTPLAGLILGALIALPFALHARSKAIAASRELKKYQSARCADDVEILMTANQFDRAMKRCNAAGETRPVLTRKQKCEPRLRPDFPGMASELSARKSKKDTEVKTLKRVREITLEDGTAVTFGTIANMTMDTPDQLLKTRMSAPRFGLFSVTNQVKQLTEEMSLTGDALERMAEAYDEYEAIKAQSRSITAAC